MTARTRNIRIDRPGIERDPLRTSFEISDTTISGDKSIDVDADLDNDGEIDTYEQRIYERKAVNRRRMAWISLIALIVSGFCLMFLVPEKRLPQLNGILELYWISLGGIVGAYVGISAWASKR